MDDAFIAAVTDVNRAVEILRLKQDGSTMFTDGLAWLRKALAAQTEAGGRRTDTVEAYVFIGCHILGCMQMGVAPKQHIIDARLADVA
jgi:hypothetical protein